jgi:hypothetical protein
LQSAETLQRTHWARETPTEVGLGRKNDRLPIHPHADSPPPKWENVCEAAGLTDKPYGRKEKPPPKWDPLTTKLSRFLPKLYHRIIPPQPIPSTLSG